jgi:transcriptional regulator with XRE-family HTH domain
MPNELRVSNAGSVEAQCNLMRHILLGESNFRRDAFEVDRVTALLRTVRKQRGLTLDEVAARTGLTKSYLSKIERGRNVPSIAVALKISQALDVDASQLFSDSAGENRASITRSGDLSRGSGEERFRPIASGMLGKAMSPFILRPDATFEEGYREHAGQELVFVHAGAIDVDLDGQIEALLPGDAAYFDASIPHRIRSTSEELAVVVVVVQTVSGIELECHSLGAA